ncbi:MAG: hypothetical protein MHM6MM_003762 [Cercozoa sp. M6MM]
MFDSLRRATKTPLLLMLMMQRQKHLASHAQGFVVTESFFRKGHAVDVDKILDATAWRPFGEARFLFDNATRLSLTTQDERDAFFGTRSLREERVQTFFEATGTRVNVTMRVFVPRNDDNVHNSDVGVVIALGVVALFILLTVAYLFASHRRRKRTENKLRALDDVEAATSFHSRSTRAVH